MPVEGIMHECIVCKGEQKVDEETYDNFFKVLDRMRLGGTMSGTQYGNQGQEQVDCPICTQCSALVETPRLIYLVFLSLYALIFRSSSPVFKGIVLVSNYICCSHCG